MKLTATMQKALKKAAADWQKIPFSGGYGCTNSTLKALETRGLVECRLTPEQSYCPGFMSWEWRLKPQEGMPS